MGHVHVGNEVARSDNWNGKEASLLWPVLRTGRVDTYAL